MIGLLRFIRAIAGIVFGWQLLGILPLLSWIGNIQAITSQMQSVAFLKLTLLITSAIIFFPLRGVINRMHIKEHGVPHPAMKKMFTL